jgi:hypothetical protein
VLDGAHKGRDDSLPRSNNLASLRSSWYGVLLEVLIDLLTPYSELEQAQGLGSFSVPSRTIVRIERRLTAIGGRAGPGETGCCTIHGDGSSDITIFQSSDCWVWRELGESMDARKRRGKAAEAMDL